MEVLYGAELVGAELKGRKVETVVVNTASGLLGYAARAFIDCTAARGWRWPAAVKPHAAWRVKTSP